MLMNWKKGKPVITYQVKSKVYIVKGTSLPKSEE